MSPARKRMFFVLTCAAVGLVVGASLAPRAGSRWVSGWIGDFFGHSPVAVAAVGAGLGLLIGLTLAWRWRGEQPSETAGAEESPPPKKRRWKAPKRFGKRGR